MAGVLLGGDAQNLENPAGSSECLLKGIVDSAHAANRIVQLDQGDDERNEQPCRHSLAGNLGPRVKQKAGDHQDPYHFHQRRRERVRHLLPQVQCKNPLGELAEFAGLCLLHRERLYDTVTCNGLVQDVGHFGHFLLVGFAQQSQLFSKPHSRIKHERSENDRCRGQFPIDCKDRDEQKNQNCPLLEEFGQCLRRRCLNALHIGRYT